MKIYETVEKLIIDKGLKIGTVEKRAGMSKGSITKWKTGSPTLAKMEAVAVVLDMTVSDLLKEVEDGTQV